MTYTLKDFDYYLPKNFIAQEPSKPRDHSRLLVLNKETGEITHDVFYHIINYLKKGDVLVLNNSKVFPARLKGKKLKSGGKVEVFLHHQINAYTWQCLLGGRVKEGLEIKFRYKLRAKVLKNNKDGTWKVKFNIGGSKFFSIINKIGFVPLPPYIKREKKKRSDKNNYQTVFANEKKIGSVAAPTAGLHFTKPLLRQLENKGITIITATLHVGLGTFTPVKSERIEEHKMHSEEIEVSAKFVKTIKKAKEEERRIIAVGTTSCRILESIDFNKGKQSFWTDIFIYPGYKFKVIDALITNFHLPKSSLLMLVSALAGKETIDKIYKIAIQKKYRFFSYGDAMFIY